MNYEDLKGMDNHLKKIDNKLKKSVQYKLFKKIKPLIPIILIIGMVMLVIMAIQSIKESFSFIKINDNKVDSATMKECKIISKEKLDRYIEIEKQSCNIKKQIEEVVSSYVDDTLKDTTKRNIEVEIDMHNNKLYWQLLATLDVLSGYSEDNDNRIIENLSQKIKPIFTYKTYDIIETNTEDIVEEENGKKIIKELRTTTETSQIVVTKVSGVFFDIEYEYICQNDYYVLSKTNKNVNNRFKQLLELYKLKDIITIEDIEQIREFGSSFPDSQLFYDEISEYIEEIK